VEFSLLISCRVPTYLMSDFEMSEMRDLDGSVSVCCDGITREGITYPMYSDIFAVSDGGVKKRVEVCVCAVVVLQVMARVC